MNRILYAIFALSGAASLAFETLWFRQAGLTFGNSVWASSLVLSSFMAGIALGNGLAAHYADRIARPVAAYALLELVIAVSGIGLVFILPSLTGAIAQLLRPFFDQPWILNATCGMKTVPPDSATSRASGNSMSDAATFPRATSSRARFT